MRQPRTSPLALRLNTRRMLDDTEVAVTFRRLVANHHNWPTFSIFTQLVSRGCLGEHLDEVDGELKETIASITVRARTAEHLHDTLMDGRRND